MIGIVTITYNSEKVIKGFINSVVNQTYSDFYVYIIDNKSSDNTLKILEDYQDDRIRLLKNDSNIGVAKANNIGIKLAIKDGCDKILIINNDVEFENDLIRKMLHVQGQENCSLVVPKMMYFDNTNIIWYAGSYFSRWNGFSPIHVGLREIDKGLYDGVYEVDYAPTCCLLINKQVFNDIGFMDEKYFVYFDDTDFLYRVFKNKKHKLIYFSDVKFFHKVGSLTLSIDYINKKQYRSDFFLSQNTRNHVYFLRKLGTFYSYLYICYLFFRNNLRIITNSKIKTNYKTFMLINRSYFEGFRL